MNNDKISTIENVLFRNKLLACLLSLICLFFIFPSIAKSETFEELIAKCAMCHGINGNSTTATTPSIAGATEEYFVHALDAYKKGGRQSEMMKMFVHSLTAEQISGLASYYEKQTFKPSKQKFDAEKAELGKKLHNTYCEKCHEQAGRITENNYGFLAGQWTPYLRQSLQAYLDKKRSAPPMMIIKLNKLKEAHGDEGVEQLLNFYASLQ